jgi:Sortilin, neurotensin receptor 3,
MGDVFISDGTGKFYSLSLENVIRGTEYVDFEKINSLDGVFLANKFDVGHSHKLSFHGANNA